MKKYVAFIMVIILTIIPKYDNESSDGSEWYDSCVCTMIKQNGAWVLDNMDLLMNNGNSVDYIKDTF